jgi:hypothetical protein
MAERPDSTPDLATIDVPTLVLTSTERPPDRRPRVTPRWQARSRGCASQTIEGRRPPVERRGCRGLRRASLQSTCAALAAPAEPERSARRPGTGRRRLGHVTAPTASPRATRSSSTRSRLRAIEALHAGESVLVAAPNGFGQDGGGRVRGRTARSTRDGKCFYTTPLKALSNQKFGDSRRAARGGQGGAAHGRQCDQRRRADRGHDDRGAAQHAVRAQRGARRPRTS